MEPTNRAPPTPPHARLPSARAACPPSISGTIPGPPSAAPSVDGVTSSAPRVVLVPVDDSDHAAARGGVGVPKLLPRGGPRRRRALAARRARGARVDRDGVRRTTGMDGGPLDVLPIALRGDRPPVRPADTRRDIHHTFWLFLGRPRRGFLSFATNALTDAPSPRRRLAALPRVHGHPRPDVLAADRSQRAGEARGGPAPRGGFHREAFRPAARANKRQARRRRHPRRYQQLERRRDRLQPREDASRVVRRHGAARQGPRQGVLRRERV